MIIALATVLLVQQDTGEQFYKFKVGSTWTYKLCEGGREKKLVMTVTKIEGDKVHLDSKEYVDDKESKAERLLWRADGGIVSWCKAAGEDEFEPVFHFYKAGSKKGDTWPGAPEGMMPKPVTASHNGTGEITVPAGTYKEAVVVKFAAEKTDEGRSLDFTFWLVPRVGIVKVVIDFGKDKNSLELQEFAEGK